MITKQDILLTEDWYFTIECGFSQAANMDNLLWLGTSKYPFSKKKFLIFWVNS